MMGEVKQETSPKSKSQHLQQTTSLQTEPLSEQSILSRQNNPIGQTMSRISNTPSPKAHADILNRAPAHSRHVLLQLQRQNGNRYVQQVVQQARQTEVAKIQAKLSLGAVGDKYEQEADRVAKQVVSNISSASQQPVQRMQPEEEEQAQMKPDIQRMATSEATTVDPSIEDGIKQARGSGAPLADQIREPMEQAFGADFSGVKVHHDTISDQLNRSIQARAFTTGQDVFFRQGEFNPGSQGGKELLAHELTHVVQQNGGAVQKESAEQGRSMVSGHSMRLDLLQRMNGGFFDPMQEFLAHEQQEQEQQQQQQVQTTNQLRNDYIDNMRLEQAVTEEFRANHLVNNNAPREQAWVIKLRRGIETSTVIVMDAQARKNLLDEIKSSNKNRNFHYGDRSNVTTDQYRIIVIDGTETGEITSEFTYRVIRANQFPDRNDDIYIINHLFPVNPDLAHDQSWGYD